VHGVGSAVTVGSLGESVTAIVVVVLSIIWRVVGVMDISVTLTLSLLTVVVEELLDLSQSQPVQGVVFCSDLVVSRGQSQPEHGVVCDTELEVVDLVKDSVVGQSHPVHPVAVIKLEGEVNGDAVVVPSVMRRSGQSQPVQGVVLVSEAPVVVILIPLDGVVGGVATIVDDPSAVRGLAVVVALTIISSSSVSESSQSQPEHGLVRSLELAVDVTLVVRVVLGSVANVDDVTLEVSVEDTDVELTFSSLQNQPVQGVDFLTGLVVVDSGWGWLKTSLSSPDPELSPSSGLGVNWPGSLVTV
jgi:hypothetical protein